MSTHSNEVKVNFTGTAILSFVIIFFLFALMSNCHGPYEVAKSEAATIEKAKAE